MKILVFSAYSSNVGQASDNFRVLQEHTSESIVKCEKRPQPKSIHSPGIKMKFIDHL